MLLKDAVITQLSLLSTPDKRETVGIAAGLRGKKGLEIGGPSGFFRTKGYFPVYQYAARVDGVNFSAHTLWEGQIKAGENYHFQDGYKNGHQFIAEGTTLEGIAANSFDFLLSCHSLEHTANPLKALKRWAEVLKPGGIFCLVLPNKEKCFDHKRHYTSFEHLVEDYHADRAEDDTTHFSEVLELHDIALDHGVSSRAQLENRTKENKVNRALHHHVFSMELIREMLAYAGFGVFLQKEIHGINLFTLARLNA